MPRKPSQPWPPKARRLLRERLIELKDRNPDLTDEKIARRAGVSPRTLSNMQSAKSNPAYLLETIRAVSQAVEWPREALERAAEGAVDPSTLEDVEWVDETVDPAELAELREDVEAIRNQQRELQERLDRIESLMRQLNGDDALGPG